MSGLSKGAIDRIGERLRDAEAPDPADVVAYIEWSATFEEPLRETLAIVDAASERAGVSLGKKTSRIKQIYSIVAKLRRKVAHASRPLTTLPVVELSSSARRT